MSTSECLGTSVMSEYGRIRSENDLPDRNFRDKSIDSSRVVSVTICGMYWLVLLYWLVLHEGVPLCVLLYWLVLHEGSAPVCIALLASVT